MTTPRAFDSLVAQTLDSQLPQFQNCQRAEPTPGLPRDGEVQLRFRVAADGNVVGAWVTQNATGSKPVAACMLDLLARLRFAARTSGGERAYSRTIAIRSAQDLSSNPDKLVVMAIKNRLRRIQACYEWLLPRAPSLRGRIRVRFNVGEDGQFRNHVPVDNTTGSVDLAACIITQLLTMRVAPAPGRGVLPYSYPFVFAPQK